MMGIPHEERRGTNGLGRVEELYHQGQYLSAYEESKLLGPLTTWQTAEGRVLAGRMANNLGGTRVGRVLHRLAFREYPKDARVTYFFALTVLARRGPFRAWQFMRSHEIETDSPEIKADWLALWSHVLATFRDFERADEFIDKALELAPHRPWIWIEKSHVLECADKYDEAIEASEKALELQPYYRPAVQSTAHSLLQLNRDSEALELLVDAASKLQSGDVLAQLAALQTELKDYRGARETVTKIPEFYPLIEQDRGRKEWLAGRISDAAYYAGDLETAATWAEKAENNFHRKMAKRLRESPNTKIENKRVMLPVGFVRQHYDTCAPATLAAISKHWNMPADHLDVVERICYDGTPAHSERQWAEQNGFEPREFRVEWETTKALIDRNLPFTLTTVGTGAAHLQAAIGYDDCRESLLIRDPGERHFREYLAEELLEQMKSTGPRGMVFLPKEKRSLLDDIDLSETEMYDESYRLELALQNHDRKTADQCYRRMVELDANHRLTISSRASLARYDADPKSGLKCVELLLKQFPDDQNLLLAKLHLLRDQGTRVEILNTLEDICQRPNCDPLFWQRLAAELAEDAREQPRVESLVRRSLRYRPVNGEALELLANVRWGQQRRKDALELYRLAASCDEKDEQRSQRFFLASQYLRKTDEAIRFLRDRLHRFGSRSAFPARTLSWAHAQLDQPQEAFAALEGAILQHPTDGALMLHSAEVYSRFGNYKMARELLERAKSIAHPTAWLRCKAYIDSYEGQLKESLKCWKEIAEAEPLARDANEAIAALLSDIESPEAATTHLAETIERFPNNYAFRVAYIESLSAYDERKLAAIEEFLEMYPVDAWGHRELTICHMASQSWDEAASAVEIALQLEPEIPVVYYLRARIDWIKNRPEQAREHCREAIKLSVDYDPAIEMLVGACDTKAERIEQLKFVQSELAKQVIFGAGLQTFRAHASGTFEQEELLQLLRDGHAERPDLWQCWSALTAQLIEMERHDEAYEQAKAAVARFPLLPRLWIDLSQVCETRHDVDGQIDALNRAREINPTASETARELAVAYQNQHTEESLQNARNLMIKSITIESQEPRNYAVLADIHWELNERDEAIKMIQQAVRLAPGFDAAWTKLLDWSRQTDSPSLVIDEAVRLTKNRPQESRSWIILAEQLSAPEHFDQRMEAIDKAIQANPLNNDGHAMKAHWFASAGHFEEAIAACNPAVYEGSPPLQLQLKQAEIYWQMQRCSEAIELMRHVTQQDADYHFAWSRLADWFDELNRPSDVKVAAMNMTRISPRDAVGWGFLGDACRRMGEKSQAKKHFRRSIDVDPKYEFGTMALFQLQLDDREFEAAAKTIEIGRPGLGENYTYALQTQLATRRGDQSGAAKALEHLCDSGELGPINFAVKAMNDARMQPASRELLKRMAMAPNAKPSVGAAAMGQVIRTHSWPDCEKLMDKIVQPEAWTHAAAKLMHYQIGSYRSRRFRKKHRERLLSDNLTWTAIADALSDAGKVNETIQHCKDWRMRPGLQPRMLSSLVANLWVRKRINKATEISMFAMKLARDNATSEHALWLSMSSALENELEEAGTWIQEVIPEDLRGLDFYRAMFETMRVLINSRNGSNNYRAAKQQLDQALELAGDEALALRRWLQHRFRNVLAKRHNKTWAAFTYQLAAWTNS